MGDYWLIITLMVISAGIIIYEDVQWRQAFGHGFVWHFYKPQSALGIMAMCCLLCGCLFIPAAPFVVWTARRRRLVRTDLVGSVAEPSRSPASSTVSQSPPPQPRHGPPAAIARSTSKLGSAWRRVNEMPAVAQPGRPFGDGAGLEDVRDSLAPLFVNEASLAPHTARSGLVNMWQSVIAPTAGIPLEMMLDYMGLGLSAGAIHVAEAYRPSMSPAEVEACEGLGSYVLQLTTSGLDPANAPMQQLFSSTELALDVIAFWAVAAQRMERDRPFDFAAIRSFAAPEPIAAPGNYPDPLGGSFSRMWDGSDWTDSTEPAGRTPMGTIPPAVS